MSILVLLGLKIVKYRPIIPYSSIQNKWYKRMVIDINSDHVINEPEFVLLFQKDPKAAMQSTGKGGPNSNSRFILYHLPG
ncbi:MAG TPA: hypothetical protein VGF79_01150, partial [Bacteroidia bacterium]